VRADDWFLTQATAAGQALVPAYSPDRPGALTRDQAITVLDSEADNYLPALQRAAAAGRHTIVSGFVAAMHWYSDIAPFRRPWTEVFQLGLTSARAIGDRAAELTCLSFCGWALYYCDLQLDQAAAVLDQAVQLAEELGELGQQAWSLSYLGSTEAQRGVIPSRPPACWRRRPRPSASWAIPSANGPAAAASAVSCSSPANSPWLLRYSRPY
jgi:hypothetical protein